MTKTNLILKYFQKAHQLTIRNSDYCKTVDLLFNWLVENDKTDNDVTTRLLKLKGQTTAKIKSNQEAILAGSEELGYFLSKHTSLIFHPQINDGAKIRKGQTVVEIRGNIKEILAYERTILNILQRMSGIATETLRLRSGLRFRSANNLHPFIAATRKTPWMLLDKKAIAVGGGLTHRLHLADGILIKDNHLKAIKKQYKLETGKKAIEKALEISFRRLNLAPRGSTSIDSTELIEIEVETEKQAYQAIETFQQFKHNNHLAIMFDNFSPLKTKTLIERVSNQYDLSQIIFEASGGITQENILKWAKTGVDIISIGALTHSPKAVNLSLEIKGSPQK